MGIVKYYKIKKFYHEKILKLFAMMCCLFCFDFGSFQRVCWYWKSYDKMIEDSLPVDKDAARKRIEAIKKQYNITGKYKK